MKIRRIYLIVSLFTLLCTSLPSFAHVHLDKSHPQKDEILSTPPTSIQLWFSGNIEAEWSKIEVRNNQGQRVETGDVLPIDNNPKTLKVELKPLTPGNYEVKWNTIAGDGHRIKGSMSFKVQ